LLISEGKDLSEIAEIICELCLAPDTESGGGIGCDNMTILIVAFLHGRTKDQWRTWVTDRVKNHIGHATPEVLPQLYSQSRLMAFKAKRAAEEARGKGPRPERSPGALLLGFLNQQQERERNIDSDSDDEDEMFSPRLEEKNSPVTNSLTRLQLNGEAGKSGGLELDLDEDMTSEPFTTPPQEAPAPPKPLPNGTTMEQKPPQFASLPGSDEASPAVKAEGLMDTSEDPLKG
jgi:protein phosphatase PTC2/3